MPPGQPMAVMSPQPGVLPRSSSGVTAPPWLSSRAEGAPGRWAARDLSPHRGPGDLWALGSSDHICCLYTFSLS